MRMMLQFPNHHPDLALDFLQPVHIFLVLRSAELGTVFQMQPYQSCEERGKITSFDLLAIQFRKLST